MQKTAFFKEILISKTSFSKKFLKVKRVFFKNKLIKKNYHIFFLPRIGCYFGKHRVVLQYLLTFGKK